MVWRQDGNNDGWHVILAHDILKIALDMKLLRSGRDNAFE